MAWPPMLKRSNGVGVTVDWGGDGEAAMLDLAPLPDLAPSRLDPASPMREAARQRASASGLACASWCCAGQRRRASGE